MNMQTMLAMALLLVAGVAQAAETLGPETALPLHEGRDAYVPCAAFNKDAYVVAWRSGYLAPGDLRQGMKFNADIVGCRVDKSGKTLDAAPFVICQAPDLQDDPRAATGAGEVLVVWHDLRNGKDWDVYGALINSDGKILSPDGPAAPKPSGEGGFLIAGGPHNQAKPQVAWDGNTFVVIWQNYTPGKGYDVRAARVSADGKVLDPQGIQMCDGYDAVVASQGDGRSFVFRNRGPHYEPGGVWAGPGFLTNGKFEALSWPSQQRGQDPCNLGGGNTPFFLGAGGGGYILSWRSQHWISRTQGSPDLTAVVFNGKGETGATLQLGGKRQRVLNAGFAWDGSAFVAVWTDYRYVKQPFDKAGAQKNSPYEGVLACRVSVDGKVLGGELVLSDEEKSPAANVCVASDGAGRSLIAFERHPETGDVPIKIATRLLAAETRAAAAEGQKQ